MILRDHYTKLDSKKYCHILKITLSLYQLRQILQKSSWFTFEIHLKPN